MNVHDRPWTIRLDPNAQAGGGAQPAAEPAAATARDVSFNPANEAPAASEPTIGSSDVSAVAQQAHSANDWDSVLDVAREYGYDFNGRTYEGDDAERNFLRDVLTQAQSNRQADYYAQLGRQLAPHYQGIQDYLKQGQQPAQPQQQQRQPWEPPEFSKDWLALVERDPQSGVFLARPGVNPAIADKVNEYDRWYQQVGSNPVQAIQPYIDKSLPTIVQQQVQQAISQYQQQQQIENIMRQNAEWMFQHDASGRQVMGVGNRPVYTQQGQRYSQLVGELERGGMGNPAQIDALARQLVLGEMAQAQLRGQAPSPPANQQRNALASSSSQRNVNQSRSPLERIAAAATTEPDSEGLSLNDMLRQAFDHQGYTDKDFENMDMMSA